MKVAPPSSLASGLMSLALLGLACNSAPTAEKKAETKAEVEAAPVGEAKLEFKPDAKPELRPETKTAEPKLEAKSELKPELATPPVEAATAPVVTAPPVPGAPGPAYFAVAKTGIVRLDGGKFTLLADSPGALVKGLQLGGDGRVWTAGFQDLMRLEGDGFKAVIKAEFSDLGGSIEDFAVTPDGQIWAVTYKGVSHHDGKAWSTEEKANIGAGDDLLQGVEVDAAGKVWVLSTHKVHVRDGGAWKDIDLGKSARAIYFDGLDFAPDGSVYALHSTALLQISPQGDKVEKVKLGRSGLSYSSLSVASNGGFALVDIDAVVTVPAGGKPRTYDKRASSYFKAGRIHAIAADDSGRVWVSSEAGVAILGPGDAKTEWPGGSVPELTGEIRGMLVVGSGPAELPGAGAVRKGGLTGKLLRDGSPLANVAVEICPSPGMIYTRTPCADAAVKFATKSDGNGVWTVSDVPIGTYGMAVKADAKWQITFGHELGSGMKEGEVFDTGSLTLEKK
jgi:hypothetical protein